MVGGATVAEFAGPSVASSVAIRLWQVLRCPRCRGAIKRGADAASCDNCGAWYPFRDGVSCMLPGGSGNDAHGAFYSSDDAARYGRGPSEMPATTVRQVHRFLAAVPADELVVEIGSGQGAFDQSHPSYVATDFSLRALAGFTRGVRVQADAQALPFADASIGAFFSVSTLEHVPRPASALAEIDRCLKPGGRAFLRPAWYVRPWTSSALHVRAYTDLSARDRIRKASIAIRNRRPYQAALVLPGRIRREWRLRQGTPLPFEYWRLTPNLSEFVVSDADAFARLDPHAVASYFVSRGYRDMNRASRSSRLMYGYEPVALVKPCAR